VIRYLYNDQKQPPAPFITVTLIHPHTGGEVRDIPAQIHTGADQTLVPSAIVAALGLSKSGSIVVVGVGGNCEEMTLFDVLLSVHSLPPRRLEVLVHPGEPWILLGRDVLNGHRVLLDGPGLVLEIS